MSTIGLAVVEMRKVVCANEACRREVWIPESDLLPYFCNSRCATLRNDALDVFAVPEPTLLPSDSGAEKNVAIQAEV